MLLEVVRHLKSVHSTIIHAEEANRSMPDNITRSQMVEFLDRLGVQGVHDATSLTIDPAGRVEFTTLARIPVDQVENAVAALGLDSANLTHLLVTPSEITATAFERNEYGDRVRDEDGHAFATHDITLAVDPTKATAS